jgi:SAM-dependent methyltransferase
MPNLFRMLRAVPFIAFYKLIGRPSTDYQGQWDSYWSSVERAGNSDQVLWDCEDDIQMDHVLQLLKQHTNADLPLVDFGCGNGRRSAWFSQHFDRVVCADASQAALTLAEQTTRAGLSNVQFEVLDLTDTAAVAAFSDRLGGGDVNVHAHGVLQLIKEKDRGIVADNLHSMIGERGALYYHDTDGKALDCKLTKPADSASGLPAGMHKVIQHGIMPYGFGTEAHNKWFSDPNKWVSISEGPATITTVVLSDGKPGAVPGLFATMLRASNECDRGADETICQSLVGS